MREIILVTLLLLLSYPAYAECLEPASNLKISNNTVFCRGEYYIGNLNIGSDDIKIICNDTALKGDLQNSAFNIKGVRDIEIIGCRIENYDIGVFVEDSENIVFKNNDIINNRIGIGILDSNNVIYNDNNLDNIKNVLTKQKQEIRQADEEIPASEEENIPSEKEILFKAFRLRNPDGEEIEKQIDYIIENYLMTARENIIINRTFEYNAEKNTTTVILKIRPTIPLMNITMYEFIPKCFSEYLSGIYFYYPDFEIIEKDPLISWHYISLSKEEVISYSSKGKVSEDCKELFRMFGIAEYDNIQEKKPINTALGIISTIIVIIIMIIMSRYRESKP